MTTGNVHLESDGSPWRPLVHVEDICRSFLAMLEAPRELVHDEAFNVGRAEDNVQVRDIAELVREAVAGSRVTFASDAGSDFAITGWISRSSTRSFQTYSFAGTWQPGLTSWCRPIPITTSTTRTLYRRASYDSGEFENCRQRASSTRCCAFGPASFRQRPAPDLAPVTPRAYARRP